MSPMSGEQISQRDLRTRSREIIDAVERGTTFTAIRGGRVIGEFRPTRQRKTYLSRDELAEFFAAIPETDAGSFLADIAHAREG